MLEDEKKIIEAKKISKNYSKINSLINKISISNHHFAKEKLINKEKRKGSYEFNYKSLINIKDKNIKRKLTKENISSIKDFVPKLKPIKNPLMPIPSKLILNQKEEKISKDPIKNILSLSLTSEEKENYSTKVNLPIGKIKRFFNISKAGIINKNSINEIRSNLIKNKITLSKKCFSTKDLLIIKKSEKKEDLDNSFGSYLNDEEFDDYMQLRKELTDKKEKINNDKFRTRNKSMSILEILEKRFKVEDE